MPWPDDGEVSSVRLGDHQTRSDQRAFIIFQKRTTGRVIFVGAVSRRDEWPGIDNQH